MPRIQSQLTPILPIIFIAAVFAFPRAFSEVKLALLGLMAIHFVILICSKNITFSKRILIFYLIFIIVGLKAALVGFLYSNSSVAIIDGIRLYIFWSVLIIFILTYLMQFNALLIIHYAIIIAALTIATLDFILVITSYIGISLYPEWFIEAMLFKIGFHDGYIQIIAHNIGMLLFIVPYLLVTVLRTDGIQEKRLLVWIALGASLLISALSGRRVLWIVIALVPYLLLAIALATGTERRIKSYQAFLGFAIGGLILFLIAPFIFLSEDTLEYLLSAFSENDERSIQKTFLIDQFFLMPIFGSGFGGVADYIRTEDAPWLYELSYHQALFNFGLVGACILTFAFVSSFNRAKKVIKVEGPYAQYGAIAILIGIVGIIIGTYSNPYLGSFDFLVVLGFLPLVASLIPSHLKSI